MISNDLLKRPNARQPIRITAQTISQFGQDHCVSNVLGSHIRLSHFAAGIVSGDGIECVRPVAASGVDVRHFFFENIELERVHVIGVDDGLEILIGRVALDLHDIGRLEYA